MKKKATLSVPAVISIDPSEFIKTKEWDKERLKRIVPELITFEMRVKTVSGIKLSISVASPTNFEILDAIEKAAGSV